MTVAEKRELEQLRQDVGTLARLAVHQHGARAELVAILDRHNANGRETRPSRLPEEREAVRA